MNTSSNTDLMITDSLRKEIPASVLKGLKSMDTIHQQSFEEDYKEGKKSKGLAFVLAFFGFHYLYFRDYSKLFWFIITLGGFGIWWIYDLTQVMGWVKTHNKDLAMRVLRDIKLIQ